MSGFASAGLRLLVLAWLLALPACSTLPVTGEKPGLRQYEWTSHDGKVLPWQSWQPPAGTQPRGVVVAVHGLSGAASDFWYLGDRLAARGYALYAFDLRGQGRDPVTAERGDIKASRLWLRDLETFTALVRKRHPGKPLFWYGESLGSLICLHAAADLLPDPRNPDGIILASPVAGLRVAVSGFKRFLLETAATLTPRSRYSLGELAGVDEKKIQVTSATTHGGQMQHTDHCIHSFTLRLLAGIGALIDKNPEAAHRLRMPVLFLASPNDVLSSPDQVQALFSEVRAPQKRLLWYTRSYHLLLHDVQKEKVATDVLQWLDRRVDERRKSRR